MASESRIANVKGRFAVVIPVYNHGRTVKAVATAASALGWPVYVVDDGSTDGGDPSLESMANLCLLRHRVNRGKGAALMTGFRAAAERADWAITLDADGQHFPEDAHELDRRHSPRPPADHVGLPVADVGRGGALDQPVRQGILQLLDTDGRRTAGYRQPERVSHLSPARSAATGRPCPAISV